MKGKTRHDNPKLVITISIDEANRLLKTGWSVADLEEINALIRAFLKDIGEDDNAKP